MPKAIREANRKMTTFFNAFWRIRNVATRAQVIFNSVIFALSFYVFNVTVSIVNKHYLSKNAISAARFVNIKRAFLSLRALLCIYCKLNAINTVDLKR